VNIKTAFGPDCKRVIACLIALLAVFFPSITHASDTADRHTQIVEKLDAMAALLKPAQPAGQFENQIRMIQQKFDQTPFVYTEVMSSISDLENQVKRTLPIDRAVLFDMAQRKMLAEIILVKQGRPKGETTLSWQRSRISFTGNLLLKTYPDQLPKQFSVLLGEFESMFDRYEKEDCERAVALAKSGWTLVQFHYPNKMEIKKLQECGAYPVKEYPKVIAALKTYYESIKNTRKAPVFEKDLEALMDDPENKQLRSKVANGFYAHLKTLDLSNVKAITSQMLIPDLIWTQVPENISSVELSKDRYDRMELAFYLFQDGKTIYAKDQLRWDDVLQSYDLMLKHYPYQAALVYRGYTHLFNGQAKEAFEDLAVSVAMSAYTWSRIFKNSMAQPNNWYYSGIPDVMVLADLAYDNKHNNQPFPSAPLFDMLQALKKKNWLGVAEYAGTHIQGYNPGGSADADFANQLRYNNGIKGKMLDAIAEAMANAKDEATRQKYLQWADAIVAVEHPAFELMKIQKLAPDAAKSKLERQLNWIGFNASFDPALNMEYAKALESEGKLDEAMLHYNVASDGKPIGQLNGIRKTAAENRNRIEGTNDKAAIAKRYLGLFGNVQKLAQSDSTKYIGNTQLVVLVKRLEQLIKLNDSAYLIRADAYRALNMYPECNEDIKYVIDHGENPKLGLLLGLTGVDNYLMGQWSEAISTLTDALGKEGQQDWVYYYRGDAYRQRGDMQKALEDFTRMLEIDPNHLASLNERSKIYQYVLHDNEKAIVDIEKYKAVQHKKNPKYQSYMLDARLYNLKRERVFGK
jgi:tetratricopeptide (TPR) repeat protein